MNNLEFFLPETLSDETIHILVSERERQKRIGKLMWIAFIIGGIIGSASWGWSFFLFAVILALVLGSVLGVQTGKKIQSLTGLGINAQMAAWKYIQQQGLEKYGSSSKSYANHNILGKITGIEKKVKWSRAKIIQVNGPPIYGNHNIFVDPNFNVAVFLPKSDKTLHVLVGDILKANRWLKFDINGKKLFDKKLSERDHEWQINPKNILYRGRMFSSEQPVYRGKVITFKDFNVEITDEWLIATKNQFIEFMHNC